MALMSFAAAAAPVVTVSEQFLPADSSRDYLDIGDVWNGSQKVGYTTGDTLRFTMTNAAATSVDPVDDQASNVAITVTLPNHFSYVENVGDTAAVSVTGAGCGFAGAPAPVLDAAATQQAGNQLTISFDPAYSLPADCALQLDYGVRVETTGVAGTSQVTTQYNFDELGAAQSIQTSLLVKAPDLVVTKTLDDADGAAAIGEDVDFDILVQSSGLGGSFDVEVEDILGAGLMPTGAFFTEISSTAGVPAATSTATTLTYDYLPPGAELVLKATANVHSCDDLDNTAAAKHLLQPIAISALDSVEIDLTQPMLIMKNGAGGAGGNGPPTLNLDFGAPSTGTAVLNLESVGLGVVRGINIDTNLDQIPGLSVTVTSPNWTLLAGMLTYSGPDVAPGEELDVEFSYSINGCPPVTSDASVTWLLQYQNACDDTFRPAPEFSPLIVNQAPELDFTKSPSQADLRTGDSGSWTLSLSGSNTQNLPDNGNGAADPEISITDTIPAGVTAVSIPSVPAGTTLLVNGSAPIGVGPYPLVSGDTVTWEIDEGDVSGVPLDLVINYTVAADAAVCVAGFPLFNTADLAYDGCDLDDSATAAVLVDERTAELNNDLQLVPLGDGIYETGLNDTNQTLDDEFGEGQAITYEASYDFNAGVTATWAGSIYIAHLGKDEPTPLTTQAVIGLGTATPQVSISVDGAGFEPVPAGCLSTNASGQMEVDLAVVEDGAGCGTLINGTADSTLGGHALDIRYSTTITDADLLGGNAAREFNERGSLLLSSGTHGCGANQLVTDVVPVNIARASLAINTTLGGGRPVQVCDVYPLTVSVPGPAGDLRADNLLFEFDTDFWKLVEANGDLVTPGSEEAEVTYGGGLNALEVAAASDIVVSATNSPAIVSSSKALQFRADPQTALYQAPNNNGTATFNVLLDPSVIGAAAGATNLNVGVSYDDHQTTAARAGDTDRDFSATSSSGIGFLSTPDLVIQITPENRFITGTQVNFLIYVTNAGSGTSFNTELRNIFPEAFVPNAALSTPNPDGGAPPAVNNLAAGASELVWQVGNLAPGATVSLRAVADLRGTPAAPICGFTNPELDRAEATYGCGGVTSTVTSEPGPNFQKASSALQVLHDTSNVGVQLCGESTVELVIKNTGSAVDYDIAIEENLGALGLTYVPGSTEVSYQSMAYVAAADPVISGGGAILTWTGDRTLSTNTSPLLGAERLGSLDPLKRIKMRFKVESPGESLNASESLGLSAAAKYYIGCGEEKNAGSNGSVFTVPVQKPRINVEKTGWNETAGQFEIDAGESVFGGKNDTLVWRIEVENVGEVAAEEGVIHDLLGVSGDFDFDEICEDTTGAGYLNCLPFVAFSSVSAGGNEANHSPLSVLPASDTHVYYLRGTVQNCVSATNSGDYEWGCPVPAGPVGGLSSPNDNTDTAQMRSDTSTGLTVTNNMFAVGGSGTPSTNGEVVIDVSNPNAGSLRNFVITDVLPAGYIYDDSYTPTVSVTGASAAVAGTVDTVVVDFTNPAEPQFTLTSNGVGASAEQQDLLRYGDTARITFRVVQGAAFDTTHDPDVRQETTSNTPTPLDPVGLADGDNVVTVAYLSSCGVAQTPVQSTRAVTPQTPDLDVDINGTINRILNQVGDSETFAFRVRNRGDAVADNASLVINVGDGWDLPASFTVPNCVVDSGNRTVTCAIDDTTKLAAGGSRTVSLTGLTVLNETGSLSLLATVEGNIEQGDGTDTTNNYSFDTIRAHNVGFRQTKTLTSTSELPALAGSVDPAVQIGEEASYQIEAIFFGTGTETLSTVKITDTLPGVVAADPTMGYVSNIVTASPNGIAATDTPPQVESGTVEWTLTDFDTSGAAKTFTATVVARVLNSPNSDATPNDHSVVLTNTANAEWSYLASSFDDSTAGFPVLANRAHDVTISTPNVSVQKTVCNQTALGAGEFCDLDSEFSETASGDAGDVLIYRLKVGNAVGRATAFDLEVTDVVPAKLNVSNFGTDLIDNDDDTLEGAEELTITGSAGGTGATLTFNELNTVNTLLGALPAGQSVTLSYSATVVPNVFPAEVLTNNVTVTYDSLDGASGVQSAAQGANGTPTGSRSYTINDSAAVTVYPVEQSKSLVLTSVSNTSDANLVIGEQAQFELRITLPEGQINDFKVLDMLPNNLDLVVADTGPAGVTVGADITCPSPLTRTPVDPLPANGGAGDLAVSYEFGDCTVNGADKLITILYTTQVRNIVTNVDGLTFENNASFSYEDDLSNVQAGPFVPVELTLIEPELVLTKSITPTTAGDTTDELDAGDIVTVQLSLENTGNAPAYNVNITDLLNDNQVNNTGNSDNDVNTSVALNDALRDIEVYDCTVGANNEVTETNFDFTFDNTDGDEDTSVEAADCLVSFSNTTVGGFLPTDGVLNFSFDATLANALVILGDTGEDYRNTVNVVASSLPSGVVSSGVAAYDRSATADPSNSDRYKGSAEFFVNVAQNSVDKSHTASSDPTTPLPDNNNDRVAIGETYTSTLRYKLSEGTTLGLVIADTLSLNFGGGTVPDLAIEAATLSRSSTALSAALDPASINAQPAGLPVNVINDLSISTTATSLKYALNMGNVVNSAATDKVAGDEEYVLTLTYRVNDNSHFRRSRAIENFAELTHSTPAQDAIVVEGDIELIRVAEPEMTIVKSNDDADGLIFAGDTVNYVIEACNDSTGPAYDLQISDVIPVGLRKAGLTAVTFAIDGTGLTTPLTQAYDVASGRASWNFVNNEAEHILPAANPNECLTISYSVTADADLAAGIELTNLATVDIYYSQPVGTPQARPYPEVGPASTTLVSPGMRFHPNNQSTVEACSPVSYSHLLDVFPGNGQGSLVINPPVSSAGFAWAMYLDANNNGSLDGSDTLLNADGVTPIAVNFTQIVVFVVALVPCETPDSLIDTSDFEVTYTVAGQDFNKTVTNITRVQAVGEGSMVATKAMAIDNDCNGTADTAFTTTAEAKPDECVVYRIRFTNDGSGKLTNVQVHDTVPSYTSYEAGTAAFEATPAGLTEDTISGPGGDGTLNWKYIDTPGLAPGEEGTVRYNVKVLND